MSERKRVHWLSMDSVAAQPVRGSLAVSANLTARETAVMLADAEARRERGEFGVVFIRRAHGTASEGWAEGVWTTDRAFAVVIAWGAVEARREARRGAVAKGRGAMNGPNDKKTDPTSLDALMPPVIKRYVEIEAEDTARPSVFPPEEWIEEIPTEPDGDEK